MTLKLNLDCNCECSKAGLENGHHFGSLILIVFDNTCSETCPSYL